MHASQTRERLIHMPLLTLENDFTEKLESEDLMLVATKT